jgi:hypothetical protein
MAKEGLGSSPFLFACDMRMDNMLGKRLIVADLNPQA